ncbi:MAG: hypothetical protein RSF67_00515 [Clostridia bacterium]
MKSKFKKGISLMLLILVLTVVLAVIGSCVITVINSNPISKINYNKTIKNPEKVKKEVDLVISKSTLNTEDELNQIFYMNNVKADDDVISEKLLEEIGMYRNWYYTNKVPDITQKYKYDLVNTPSGIDSLYYVSSKSKLKQSEYIYDLITGIVYVKRGLEYDNKIGYSIYSIEGIKNNNILSEVPNFKNTKIVNNTKDKINYSIISDNSDSIFKHYENGEVYAIGLKGSNLNTSVSEMNKLDTKKFKEFIIPEVISKYKKIIPTYNNIYVIDNNDELWALGDNKNNKFCLNDNQLKSYTKRSAIKLNINKEIKNVYDYFGENLFVITNDNEVYVSGYNKDFNLGLGHNNNIDTFTKINLDNVSNIIDIQNGSNGTIIVYNDNKYYYSGNNLIGLNKEFKQIFEDIDQDITKIVYGDAIRIIKKDSTLWQIGYTGIDKYGSAGAESLIGNESNLFRTFDTEFSTNVVNIFSMNNSNYILRKNNSNQDELWVAPGNDLDLPITLTPSTNKNLYYKMYIPEELYNSSIKEIFTTKTNIYYLASNGTVWISGNGLKEINDTNLIKKINIKNVNFNWSNSKTKIPLFKFSNDKLYIAGNDILMNQDNTIQNTFKKVASDVKKFTPGAYIDFKDNLWISGYDSTFLGIEKEDIKEYKKYNDSKFNGKIKDVKKIINGVNIQNIFITTIDNKLYSAGTYNKDSYISGINSNDNKHVFTEILQNVNFFDTTSKFAQAITYNNIYGWGKNADSHIESGFSSIPKKINLPNELNIDNIKSLDVDDTASFILTNLGEVWVTGSTDTSYTGLGNVKQYTKFDPNIFNNEKIVKLVIGKNSNSRYAITEKGNLYVWGKNNVLRNK